MKRLLLSLLTLGLSCLAVQAQGKDVIYLKNGSVIKGSILEYAPEGDIKIRTEGDNLFVYPMQEVLRVAKEEGSMQFYSDFNKPKGYLSTLEFDLGIGIGDWYGEHLSVRYINGYRVVPQFAVGIGVGFQHYTSSELSYYSQTVIESVTSMPIFLHLRSDFLNKKVSPFVETNIGYNVALDGGYFNGLLFEETVGVSFNVGSRKRLAIGLTYSTNEVNMPYNGLYWEVSDREAISIKVGLSF